MSLSPITNWSRFLGLLPALVLLLVWLVVAVVSYLVGDPWLRHFYTIVSPVALCVYAYHRAHRHNPATNCQYNAWLRRTPWEWGRPLPLGWVRLNVSDLVLVVVFAWLYPHGPPLGLLLGGVSFALGYVVAMARCAMYHSETWMTRGSVLLLGLGVASSVNADGPSPASLAAALLGMLLLSQFSIPRLLRQFDELEPPSPAIVTAQEMKRRKRGGALAGSPWRELLKGVGSEPESTPGGWHWLIKTGIAAAWLFICVEFARRRLVAWASTLSLEEVLSEESLWGGYRALLYVACHAELYDQPNPDYNPAAPSFAFCGLTLALVILGWLGALIGGYWPPMNPLGRLATGRLIIPGYDYVFVGAIVSVATYLAIEGLLLATTDLGFATGGIALAAALVALVKLTPSIESWRLTGHHRIMLSKKT